MSWSAPWVVLVAALLAAQDKPAPAAAQAAAPGPARAESIGAIAGDVSGKAAESALGWVEFLAAGCSAPAEHLGHGDAADAELALGEAIEKSVKAFVDKMPGKKTKIRLNDAAEGTVTKIDPAGIVLNLNKADTLVAWGEVDPGKLAAQMAKAKPTAEPDIAAIAVLKLLGGDPAEAKRQATKLTSELGKKLGELNGAWKEIAPEFAAARAIDSALREKDSVKAVEKFKAGWAAASATKVGAGVAAKAREQFVLRGEQAFSGDTALKAIVHGKITPVPARAHPAAGPRSMGLDLEFEFEKDAEAGDFDPNLMNRTVKNALGSLSGRMVSSASAFKVDSSRLTAVEPSGGELPIEFGGDVEIEVVGGLSELVPDGSKLGALSFGFTTADGGQMVVMTNFNIAEAIAGGKPVGKVEKKIEPLKRGEIFVVNLKLAGNKLKFSRNGEEIEPFVDFTPSGPMLPFALGTAGCQWFAERVVIRGTATRSSLDSLARVVAEREAKALFGS